MDYRVLALVCCLLLAGCAAPAPTDDAPENPSGRDDPDTDQLGWENGYWYDDPLTVNQSAGLNESELTALVARTMARVERIRGLEFERTVPVEVISRETYRNQSGGRDTTVDSPGERAREQLWEAPLLVGEDRTVGTASSQLYGSSVLGYYSPGQDRIVLVSDSERLRVDRTTLAHELVHALQDQRLSLLGGGTSHDAGLARTGVVEGDANYVEYRYEERCSGDWGCVARPDRTAGASIDDRNLGLYLTIYMPYSDGPAFVHRVRKRGGWSAVNDLYERPPASSEQLLHPERYPGDSPETVRLPDRSGENWERYGGAERVGESTLYAMFWFQRGVNRSTLRERAQPYSDYNYVAPPSSGWAGDRLVTYRDGDADGYVWRLRWESRSDAREFASAYRSMLTQRLNATEVRSGVYRIPSGPFTDAFRVERDGRTVSIVNAPSVRELDRVHAESD